MFRYLAFVWHDHDLSARETARRLIERHNAQLPDWRVAFKKRGVFVGYTGARAGASEPYVLHGGTGVVLGKLFARSPDGESAAAPLSLSEPESRAIIDTAGRRLIDRYWGRYVAFLQDPSVATTWVLRDPSGGLPCLTVRFGGVDVYFSSVDEILHLGLGPFQVNWAFLAASVCLMREHSHGSGLCEVAQVLAGECLELRADRFSSSFYWNPVEIAQSERFEDPLEAAKSLRRCVRDTVHAWASSYSGILLSLSGGLDSSIVFSCLRDAPTKPNLTVFHHYPTDTDLDERSFARLVAKSGNCELIERPRKSAISLEPFLQVQLSHEPANYLYHLESSRPDAALAAEHQCTAIFTGWGGDQLFGQDGAIWAAGDHMVNHGLRPAVFRAALDAARVEQLSVWKVLGEGLAQYLLFRRWSIRDESTRSRHLIRPEVVEEVHRSATFLHPLLRDPGRTPSGKRWQLHQILNSPWEFYDPFGEPGDAERVAPLYSQPVLEVCLRMPSYLLMQGGWDRAVARRAFHSDVPRQIINRRRKAGIEAHVIAIFWHNLAFMRELLLDGELARAGIIDRKKVAEVLSGNATRVQMSRGEIYDYIGIEAWLRRWGKRVLRAAA